MLNFYEPREVFGEDIIAIKRDSECIVYGFKDFSGEGTMKIYEVFPGIQLIFNDFAMGSCFREVKQYDEIIGMNYCLKGRYECEFRDDSLIYIGEGDLAISSFKNKVIASSFPTKNFKGISVMLHKSLIESSMKHKFQEYSIDFKKVLDKTMNAGCKIMRANGEILHIFSELYSACNIDSARRGYFKLKVLELILFMSICDDIIIDEKRKRYSKEQIEIVKHIKSHLEENSDRHITIDELAKEHGIAKTTLKGCFKQVYGISPYAYMKEYRMKIGSEMLANREKNVTEIAMYLGYQNVSKFSKAFKDVLGYSPKEYQNRNNVFLE